MSSLDDSGGSVRKGAIYENIVKYAFEKASFNNALISPSLPGVIADQDIVWPNEKNPKIIASVTHWGSHEAAKMKFWRVHEDLFECYGTFPRVAFLSVLFDRNEGSDENLCKLLEKMCGGFAISDLNCEVIKNLQNEVSTSSLQKRFGIGNDDIYSNIDIIYNSDNDFKVNIDKLASSIKHLYENVFSINSKLRTIILKGSQSATEKFHDPGSRVTYFKPALLALLDIGDDLEITLKAYADNTYVSLPEHLINKLLFNRCIEEKSDELEVIYVPTEVISELARHGIKWCKDKLELLRTISSNKNHYLYSYHDHINDITKRSECQKRLDILITTKTIKDMTSLLVNWGNSMNRCWPIDYALSIQRANTKGKIYGVQKLSLKAKIPYNGAPVSCPLPCYASGKVHCLNEEQIKSLANAILDLKKRWLKHTCVPEIIQEDRKITLMKKFSSIDVIVEEHLKKQLPKAIIGKYIVKHPYSDEVKNSNAGSTEYNIKLSYNKKNVFIFIVAAWETSHKHKELSGRLRSAIATNNITTTDLCLILNDGNLLYDNSRETRIKMLKDAGWSGAYSLDQINIMVKSIKSHLNYT